MSDTGIDKLTPKQLAFVEAYLACGSAADAYRQTYACANMAAATIQREATRLLANPRVHHTITTLRARAADKAVLDKAWVLAKLRENIEVSLGERTIRLKTQKRDKETGAIEVFEVEVSAHDAAAANKGLELLARHLGLFEADNTQAGKAAGEALAEGLDDLAFARWLAHKLSAGARQAEAGENDDKLH